MGVCTSISLTPIFNSYFSTTQYLSIKNSLPAHSSNGYCVPKTDFKDFWYINKYKNIKRQ